MDTSIHYTCLTEAELATIDGGGSVFDSAKFIVQTWNILYNSGRDFGRSIVNGIMHQKGESMKLEETRFRSLSEQELSHVDGGSVWITVGLIATPLLMGTFAGAFDEYARKRGKQ